MPPRMKSIELQGYKTFANKVCFEFPLPITAIVGPNGSGKSNISDAIRWVLGEQSYATLRGRRTTDMIFSGSDKKARANMASATITFDNSDHWLPMDYVEVAITRRAYRDGQNEYLINGQKVRLKDVNELLAQSGLSERTYTIIGQGLIDNALSASPEDRRRFFEEAAGIGLFRSRREEALIRLKETAHNLERVNDILSELEPRVHSLERQAKRAAEYGHVTDELKHLLREWYGYHWHHAQQDLLVVRERFNQQEKRTDQIRAQFESLDESLKKKQNEIRELRMRLSEMHKKSADVHKRIEQLTRDNAILDERKNSVMSQIHNQQDESALLTEELELILSRGKEISASLESLRAEEKEALEQKASYSVELNKRMGELNDLRAALRAKRDEQDKLESKLIRLKARRDDLDERTKKLEESLSGLRVNLERLENGLRTFQQDNQKFYDAQKQNEDKLSNVISEISAAEKEIAERDVTLRNLRSEKNRVDAELTKVSARLDVLNDAEKHFSGMNRGAQYVAQSAEKGLINSSVVSLQSMLNVPKEYETVVAAALGDELDAVILDPSEWNKVMDLLNKAQSGRAVLLGTDEGSLSPENSGFEGCETLRPLLSLISYDEKVKPVIERILSNTWLADSRTQAMNLKSKLHPGQRIVTMDGDLFRADGSAVSGSEGKQKLLSRTREIRELSEERNQISAKSDELNDAIKNAEKELAALREQLKAKQ
ncbi:MAG: AAA family ATPase, partial [Anaerolineaceae bacterium]|nr:AAA family ATPase [Anaerolineaceae bacterium]